MDKMMFKASALRELMLRRNSVQRFIDQRCRLEDSREIWKFFYENPHIGIAVARNFEMTDSAKRKKFLYLMSLPKLHVVFAGFKGSGKTALAYWIAEELNSALYGSKKTCILYPISFNPEELPWYFYPAENDEEIDNGDYCIFDEAQLRINSRRSQAKINVDFTSFLTIQRHHNISMLVIQQDIAMSDFNTFRMADGFIFKPSGAIQLGESMSKKNVLMKFLEFLKPMSNRETLYISSDLQTIILFENPLASFWTEKISTPTAHVSMTDIRDQTVQGQKVRAKYKRETAKEILKKEYG